MTERGRGRGRGRGGERGRDNGLAGPEAPNQDSIIWFPEVIELERGLQALGKRQGRKKVITAGAHAVFIRRDLAQTVLCVSSPMLSQTFAFHIRNPEIIY